jgi:hypothetical protein
VYLSTNLQVDQNVRKTIAILERAAKAGCNGVVLADYKFMRWDDLPGTYADNVRRVRQACRQWKLECIACVMPIGYSNALLSRDPNLAAGLPVKDAPFLVRAGRIVPDDSTRLLNGSFERYRGHKPEGWAWADKCGLITFIDPQVKFEGRVSLRMQDIDRHAESGNGRVMQSLKVRPFSYYHLWAAVKTEDFAAAGNVRVAVLAEGGASLNFHEPRIQPTQDWKQIHVVFNSLEFDRVNVYLGVWGGAGGKIWWDDVRMEPAGLVNVVRRAGAPLRATSRDGKTGYVEGKDFAGAVDPLMGRDPYVGEYTVWHKEPAMTVPAGSRLKEGDRLAVSCYHTAVVHDNQVMCDLSEPKVLEILDWQIEQVHKHVQPDGYFMGHDEIRVQGWEPAFERGGLRPAKALADNVRRCAEIIRKRDPGKRICIWSDMFDPYHNARKAGRYYLVKGDGPWHGSWEGLPADVVVVNWHGHAPGRAESLKHFAARGHKQVLAGYYDGPPGRIGDWLRDAAGVEGVIGVMYTTWQHKYDDLGAFFAEVDKFNKNPRPR